VFHTRQQHSYKVAQVGRRLAQLLIKTHASEAVACDLDAEVVEAACLAHDLGHPPFGHIGEEALDELVSPHDRDGFEGNAQSFRILTRLAVRFPEKEGMDLTRATLAASIKYPWHRGSKDKPKKHKKWSAYKTEKVDFEFAREFIGGEEKSIEASLMDWADDVAYSAHDLEDFHRCNAIPWHKIFRDSTSVIDHAAEGKKPADKKRLEDAYLKLDRHLQGNYGELLREPYEGNRYQREQLRRMTSQFIGTYIEAVTLQGSNSTGISVEFDQVALDEVALLKQITRDYIISSPSLAAQQHGQRKIIEGLFNEIYSGLNGRNEIPDFLPVRLRYLQDIAGTSHARFAADCIASLTEREATALHARLFGIISGSVLDPIVR
jgi:dGTPase